jgi:hypothetical protein
MTTMNRANLYILRDQSTLEVWSRDYAFAGVPQTGDAVQLFPTANVDEPEICVGIQTRTWGPDGALSVDLASLGADYNMVTALSGTNGASSILPVGGYAPFVERLKEVGWTKIRAVRA